MMASFPVFVDLIWERHRSPLIAAITMLRLLQAIYLSTVFDAYIDASTRTCADYAGDDVPFGTDTALTVLQLVFTISAALVACRANSWRWMWLACPTGIAYLCALVILQFRSCASLINANIGDANGIAVVSVTTIDLACSVMTLGALLVLTLDMRSGRTHVPALPTSYPPSPTPDWGAQSAKEGGTAPPAADPLSLSWYVKVARGAAVAPLRHHIAVVLAFFFCLIATILMGVLGPIAAKIILLDYWNPFADDFNAVTEAVYNSGLPSPDSPYYTMYKTVVSFLKLAPDIINKVSYVVVDLPLQLLYAAVLGASVACVVVVVSMSASYAMIHDDNTRLAAALCTSSSGSGGKTDPADDDEGGGESNPFVKHASDSDASLLRSEGGVSSRDDEMGADKSSGAAAANCVVEYCCTTRRVFLSSNHGTPDVASSAFAYTHAFTYTSLYAIK